MLVRPPPERRRGLPKSEDTRKAANARQARWRRRAEAGRMVERVEVNARHIDLLVRTHWLAEADAGDRTAINRALQAMLDDAAR
jgi:hypothetical protein